MRYCLGNEKCDQEVHPIKETLPKSQRVFRVKVVMAFLKTNKVTPLP